MRKINEKIDQDVEGGGENVENEEWEDVEEKVKWYGYSASSYVSSPADHPWVTWTPGHITGHPDTWAYHGRRDSRRQCVGRHRPQSS